MTPPEEPAPLAAQDGLEAFAALAAHQLGEAIALMRGAASVLEGEQPRPRRAGGAAGAGRRRRPRAALRRRPARRRAGAQRAARRATRRRAPARLRARRRARRARPVPAQRRRCTSSASRCRARRWSAADARRLFLHFTRARAGRGRHAPGRDRQGARATGVVVELYDNGDAAPRPGRRLRALRAAPRARPAGRRRRLAARLPAARRARRRAVAMAVRADGATVVTLELPAA